MNTHKLSDFSKLDKVCLTDKKDLSRSGHYSKFYHNLESSAKCPRCQNLSELVESGPARALYRCDKCGIFSKLTPKKRLHGLKQSIAQGELTTALEILERAGHEGTDAIAALNRYRENTDGNAGDASQDDQKTTASNNRCGFVLFEN